MSPESIGLLEISDVTTGSSNTVDSKDQGKYPFFDRSQVIKCSDKYIFDAEAVIVPGEGMDFIPRYVNGKFDLHQRAYAVFPKEGLVDGKYLYYAILNNKSHFSQVATGSTVKSLRHKSFELMKIPLFELGVQKKISKILFDIDSKISINNAINDNLAELSWSLFNEYIVKEGGQSARLVDIAKFKNGLPMQKHRPQSSESYPVLKIRELNQGYCDLSSERCSIDIPLSVIIDEGDVVFSWSGSLIVKLWGGERCGLNQHLYKVESDKYPKWFYFYWLKVHLPEFREIAADKATTMGHICHGHLEEATVIIPDDRKLIELDKIMGPIMMKQIEILHEIKTLTQLRDIISSRVFSGDIDLTNAQLVN